METLEELAAEFIRLYKPDMDIENTKIIIVKSGGMQRNNPQIETALVCNTIRKLKIDEKNGGSIH